MIIFVLLAAVVAMVMSFSVGVLSGRLWESRSSIERLVYENEWLKSQLIPTGGLGGELGETNRSTKGVRKDGRVIPFGEPS